MYNLHPFCIFQLFEIISFAFREILQYKKEEKKALYRALMSEGNGSVCPVLKKILPFGMAYHHSGI
jgi:POLQ-like helicase